MFTITSSATFGIKAVPISVETDIASGLPAFTIVGLPDTSVRESRDRIRSAIRNSRFSFPRGRVTVNLAPAHLRKQGVIYDLPIALSLLIGMGKLSEDRLVGSVFLGELGLHGEVRSVPGVLPSALMAKRTDRPNVFVPKGNAPEAALIEGVRVFGVSTLLELVDYLNGEREISPEAPGRPRDDPPNAPCFSTIRGHAFAKRGLEIAAAGRHNVLLQGPPGTGKTLLARSFPSLLPALTHEEAIEVASIASVAGVWAMSGTLPRERPFRAPHHSCSAISLIGGGTWPAPGEVSLAHHGVLFLDELPEFGRHTLETLRQPLEDGTVTIARASGAFTFPAKFQLIATRNPCPCGFLHDPRRACSCGAREIQQYERRVSGPLIDRIDLVIDVPNVQTKQLCGEALEEPSCLVRARVVRARECTEVLALSPAAKRLLEAAFSKGTLSTRGFFRIQTVARTIAVLADAKRIEEDHLAEAIQYRTDRGVLGA